MSEKLKGYTVTLDAMLGRLEDGGRPPNPHAVNLVFALGVIEALRGIEERLEYIDGVLLAASDEFLDRMGGRPV